MMSMVIVVISVWVNCGLGLMVVQVVKVSSVMVLIIGMK